MGEALPDADSELAGRRYVAGAGIPCCRISHIFGPGKNLKPRKDVYQVFCRRPENDPLV